MPITKLGMDEVIKNALKNNKKFRDAWTAMDANGGNTDDLNKLYREHIDPKYSGSKYTNPKPTNMYHTVFANLAKNYAKTYGAKAVSQTGLRMYNKHKKHRYEKIRDNIKQQYAGRYSWDNN